MFLANANVNKLDCHGVKLASAYVALALGLSTVTALLVRTLCTHTYDPSSGDVKL